MTVSVDVVRTPAGNFGRLRRGLERAGARVRWRRTDRWEGRPRGLVLAGVSAFGTAAGALRPGTARIRQWANEGVPILGICAGYQALFEASEESPGVRGLGLFPGRVRRLGSPRRPHLGWSRLERIRRDSWLLREVPEGSYVYFAHSYRAPPGGASRAAATAYRGERFPSASERGPLAGVQFHPEISGPTGARVLRNFVARVEAER